MTVHQRGCGSALTVLIVDPRARVNTMAEESHALSTIPRIPPTEAEYDALCHALMATARGRWFLEEYARRNRNTDTGLVLDAIARIGEVIRKGQAHQAQEGLRIELLEMARAIAQTRAEVAESRRALNGQDADNRPEAINEILTAAERLQDLAWTMRERGFDMAMCDEIAGLAAAILSASSLRNPNDERTLKFGEVLRFLERRIDSMLAAAGGPEPLDRRLGTLPAPEAPPAPAAEAVRDEIGPQGEPEPDPPCPPRASSANGHATEPVTEPLPAGGLLEIRPLVVTPVDIARPDARQIDLDPIPVEPWSAPASAKTSSTGAEAAPASDPLAALKAMSDEERLALFT